MGEARIGVLIVDDSAFFRESLKRSLENEPGLHVVGEAADAEEAVRQIQTLRPDAGSSEDAAQFASELKAKLLAASYANRSVLARHADRAATARDRRCPPVLAFGASTGGTEALYTILKDLPHFMPGMVAVLHMPPVFTRLYAERLADICRMDVLEAEDGMAIQPGRVLIAPGDRHLRIQRGSGGLVAALSAGERVNGHRPSVDELFDSVAQTAGTEAVGIILTGMGSRFRAGPGTGWDGAAADGLDHFADRIDRHENHRRGGRNRGAARLACSLQLRDDSRLSRRTSDAG